MSDEIRAIYESNAPQDRNFSNWYLDSWRDAVRRFEYALDDAELGEELVFKVTLLKYSDADWAKKLERDNVHTTEDWK